MKEIIAMHGWAGDSKQWSSWIDLFKCCDWEWQTAERGYKDMNPSTPRWNNETNKAGLKRVAICHSLGLHLLDKRILWSATHVVLINCFSRFIPSSKESRSVTIALNRMMNAIDSPNELSMLKKFHIKAYKPNHINVESTNSNLLHLSDSGRVRLKNDLKLLINSDSLPTSLNSDAKVLIMNSENDYILTKQTKEKLAEDLRSHLEVEPTIINSQEEGHLISKMNTIKKIKHWLELDHAKNLV